MYGTSSLRPILSENLERLQWWYPWWICCLYSSFPIHIERFVQYSYGEMKNTPLPQFIITIISDGSNLFDPKVLYCTVLFSLFYLSFLEWVLKPLFHSFLIGRYLLFRSGAQSEMGIDRSAIPPPLSEPFLSSKFHMGAARYYRVVRFHRFQQGVNPPLSWMCYYSLLCDLRHLYGLHHLYDRRSVSSHFCVICCCGL